MMLLWLLLLSLMHFSFKKHFFWQIRLNLALLLFFLLPSTLFIKAINQTLLDKLPFLIYQKALLFLISVLLLLILISVFSAKIVQIVIFKYPKKHKDDLKTNLIVFSFINAYLLIINGIFFPNSRFSQLFIAPFPAILIKALFIIANGLFLIVFLSFIKRKHFLKKIALILGITLFFLVNPNHLSSQKHQTLNNNQTNIVLIGIDSLQLDKITPKIMPHLSQLLKESMRYQNATTPIARTYPSWISLLSGQNPNMNQARFNLISDKTIDKKSLLSALLQQKGYETIYASDDRRFSPIDKSYGFDKIIGPKSDAFDFLLSGFNDLPIVNLIALFPSLNKILFPYHPLNRAHWQIYHPDDFNKALQKAISPSNKPLFLATHFTLSHWPYRFRSTKIALGSKEDEIKQQQKAYVAALSAIDMQIFSLLQTLKENKPQPTLIFLLSDHGETLLENNSQLINQRYYQDKKESRLIKALKNQFPFDESKSIGHGGSLLSPKQNEVLLAIYALNQTTIPAKIIKTPVSLIDIKPTLLSTLFNDKSQRPYHDLLNLTKNSHQNRPFYFETDLNLINSPKSEKVNFSDIAKVANQHYAINTKDLSLHLLDKNLPKLMKKKQYGLRINHILYVLYPIKDCFLPITLDLEHASWSESLNGPFAKKHKSIVAFNNLLSYINYPKALISQDDICTNS